MMSTYDPQKLYTLVFDLGARGPQALTLDGETARGAIEQYRIDGCETGAEGLAVYCRETGKLIEAFA